MIQELLEAAGPEYATRGNEPVPGDVWFVASMSRKMPWSKTMAMKKIRMKCR